MATDKRYLFLVDDEPIQNEMLKDFLSERFLHEIRTYESGEKMLQDLHLNPEIVVLDYHLSGSKADAKNGVEILKAIKDAQPDTQVIMLSGQDKIEVAIDSMKYGAYDYVIKGETAFSRMENLLNNLGEYYKIKAVNSGYKKTITILGIVVAIFIAISIYLYAYGPYGH